MKPMRTRVRSARERDWSAGPERHHIGVHMTIRAGRVVAAALLVVAGVFPVVVGSPTASARPAEPAAHGLHQATPTTAGDNADADACLTMDCYRAAVGPTFLESQDALLRFNAALNANPAVATGFAGTVDDPTSRSVAVYWAGSIPASLDLDALSQQYGVSVSVVSWPVDRNTLNSTALKVANALRLNPVDGFRVTSVGGFNGSFGGLSVAGVYDQAKAGEIVPLVAGAVSLLTNLPVRILNQDAGNGSGRYNDTSPFDGGDLVANAGDVCSTGFSFLYGTIDKVSTARHCVDVPYHAYSNSGTNYGGSVATSGEGQARILVADGIGYVWDGTTLGSVQQERVADSVIVSVGDRICDDGANGGLHCNLLVNTVDTTWFDGQGTAEYIDHANRTSDGASFIQGDSGGPVIMPIANSSDVHAVGMGQEWIAPDLEPNCGYTPKIANTANKCTSDFGFSPVWRIIAGLEHDNGRTVALDTN